jgi:polysaccharide deacetylase family protein (PEP-CTERM system associated)
MISRNIFTVDLEEWYHANYRPLEKGEAAKISTLAAPTRQLLDLLRRFDSRATFFCLGAAAEQHPDLIREIAAEGHEIASHSFDHELIYSRSKNEFESDLQKVTLALRAIMGMQPLGYRAPSWSVDRRSTPWFWPVLEAAGYRYSSSLFPLKTFLYGDSTAPRFRHAIGGVLEIPPSTLEWFGRRMAFSGGFYLRFFPITVLRLATRHLNSHGEPVVFYIHPREIDTSQPRLSGLSAKERFIHYYNIRGTLAKLENVLRISKTCSISEYYGIS